ncbi:hypothetical protein ILUMI_26074 [Ignelater luminosus]|uniref:Uncharacterized protein n=1 Tax=Ignelater luminosus TaxID=2038154 RepID=A0A8K0C8P2_IGNLU|nr:hypothetical protein ILUMI_26074 [Ignelater luminosus]
MAKILLQQLWLEKVSWDESLSQGLHSKWLSFRSELVHLNDIKIPRHVICNNPRRIELHGFADASTFAYGGCLYIRSTNEKNQIFTRLLCSKTRVAPLKTITISRLELSAALILARLASQVMKAIQINFSKCVLWSDSTVTLGWLKTPPNLLKTFVANRVAEIQEVTEDATWKHVPTNSNPADLLSRGVLLKELANSSLWWSGPAWLSLPQESWPKLPVQAPVLPDLKGNAVSMLTVDLPMFPFANYSNLNKLERIVAYCLRFTENCRKRLGDRNVQPISFREIQTAQRRLVKIALAESFQTEIHLLENGKPLKSTSRLLNLNPFLDSEGLLRVGGRLQNSFYNYNKKHPLILSSKHCLTKLIFSRRHEQLLHAGPQMLLASVCEVFWPLGGRSLARQTVHFYSQDNIEKLYEFVPKSTLPQDYGGNAQTTDKLSSK